MKQVKISVTAVVDPTSLHQENRHVEGEYIVEISDNVSEKFMHNAALDILLRSVPVKVLDDFVFVVKTIDGEVLPEPTDWDGYSGEYTGKVIEKLDLSGTTEQLSHKVRLYVMPASRVVNKIFNDPYCGTYVIEVTVAADLDAGMQAAALLAHQVPAATANQYVVGIAGLPLGSLRLMLMRDLRDIYLDVKCSVQKVNCTWPAIYCASLKKCENQLMNQITFTADSEEEANKKAVEYYSRAGLSHAGVFVRRVRDAGGVVFPYYVQSVQSTDKQRSAASNWEQRAQLSEEEGRKRWNELTFPLNNGKPESPSPKQVFEPTVINTEQGGLVLQPGFVSSVSVSTMPGGELDDLLLHVQPYPVGSVENIGCPGEKISIFFGCFGSFSDTLESTDELLARVGAYLGGVILKNFINEGLQQFITFKQYTQLQTAGGEQTVKILEKRGFLKRV